MEDGEVVEALRIFAMQTRFDRLYRSGGLEDQDARTLAACVELGDVWAAVQVLAAEERVGRGR